MRKTLVIGMVVVALLSFGAVTAFAQGGRGGMDLLGGRYDGDMLAAVAEALGLEADALIDELQDGKTVAEIAEAQGVDLADVVAALTADYAERLADEVADGDLTQAQADAMLALREANLMAALDTMTFDGPIASRMLMMDRRGGFDGTMLAAVAETLGLDADALIDELQDGKTVAEIAEAQDVALEDVIAAVLTDYAAELADEVADGDLTQAQADARLAILEANLEAHFSGEVDGFWFGMDRAGMFDGPMAEQMYGRGMMGRDGSQNRMPGRGS
jgi:urease gamma subunit